MALAAAGKTIKKNPGPRLHFQGSYFGVWHNTAMWCHPKENSEDAAQRWGSPGRNTAHTAPTAMQPLWPLPKSPSPELPCSPPPDP